MKTPVSKELSKAFKQLGWLAIALYVLLFLLQAGLFYVFLGILSNQSWQTELVLASISLVLAGIATYILVENYGRRIITTAEKLFDQELRQLRNANKRAKSLRAMASTLRATLSFERVVEEALDVCSLSLEEMGIPPQSLFGAVFLFKGDELVPVANRRFTPVDQNRRIPGRRGIVGKALTQAEPTFTNNPRHDPELRQFMAFQNCLTAVCIPLRAGFQIFGAMILGTDTAVNFNEEHLDLFNAVADQAVIALQNAQLYQQLEEEKQRLLEADQEARKELARDLHDGPTQSIAAIAMRVNFIRTLITRDPEQALQELEKVEELAKRTSKEIRGMLFTLRPLVLETQGLAPAIETVINRIRETDGLNIRLVGGEHGELLNKKAQSVVFSIVEEALGNARKYSKANLIEVRFWKEENLFVAQVRDDGVGFDVQSVNKNYSSRGSLGMVNMHERAERIDGSLQIESMPGRGTSVTLVVPLDKHGSHVPA